MRKVSVFIISVLLGFQVLSCQNQSKDDEVNKAHKEVMDLHDELMAKMEQVMQLKKETIKRVAELDSTSSSTHEKRERLENIANDLQGVNDSMMDWMHHFKPDQSNKTSEEVKAYLEGEKVKLKKMKEEYLKAIKEAKEV